MMAVAVAAICSSCSKDNDVMQSVTPPTTEAEGQEITINFTTDAATRAFFDSNADAESWEKQINKATIYLVRYHVYVAGIAEVISKELTATDIANGSVTMLLEAANLNNFISVSIVANLDAPDDASVFNIYSSVIATLDKTYYNGTFEEVSTSAKHSDGFPMYGTGSTLVSGINNIGVSIEMKRDVSKIAIETSLSDNFNNSNMYAGDLRIDEITVRTADKVNSDFEDCDTHTQASNKSGDKYQNLFYMQASYSNHFLVNATYDADGDFSTTSDQKQVTYEFSIDNEDGTNKSLLANCYYRISVIVNTLDIGIVDISVSTSDWLSLDDQSIEIMQ